MRKGEDLIIKMLNSFLSMGLDGAVLCFTQGLNKHSAEQNRYH